MKTRPFFFLAVLLAPVAGSLSWAAGPQTAPPAQNPATVAPDADHRAEIYYELSMAHLYQQEYEATGNSDDADRAIDFFKKAYALDPSSQVIGEQVAEMYFLSQRIREAVSGAEEVLRRDASNLGARRLLARIYLRMLGDVSPTTDQRDTISRAIEQLDEIVRLDPADIDSALWLARLDRMSNQNERAERVLRAVLMQDPDQQSALDQLAQLLLDQNKAEEAVSLLKTALQRNPDASLYDELGDAWTLEHDLSQAEQAYRSAVELDPSQASHLQSLGQCLFDEGKYQEALDPYQKLVALHAADPNNYLRLAEIYTRLHQLEQAEQQIILAKQRAPGNLEVIYNEATIYQAEGRSDDAIRLLTDAIAAVKGQTEVTPARRRTLAILYQLLGQLYRDAENYTAAVNTFQGMVQLGPEEDVRARVLIIETYGTAHDLPHAFAEASQALAAHPQDRSLHISQALLYGENNQPDQAAEILRPLLDNSPSDLDIYVDLAQVYQEGHRFSQAEEAIGSAEKIVTGTEDRETIGLLLGGVYERQKKYDQAEMVFKGVLALNPRNAAVLNYYGYMLADRGLRLDEAVQLVQRALAEDPANPAYLDSIGWAYYKQDKLDEAESFIRQSIQHDSHDPDIISHLGDVLAKKGYADQAAAEWEKSLAEWRRALPAEIEPDKIAELEEKISNLKRRPTPNKASGESKPH